MRALKIKAKTLLGIEVAETERDPRVTSNATIERTRAAIRVSGQVDTYLFNISVESTDPEKAIKLANMLAQIYLDNQIQTKFEATEFAVDWLSKRVNELERQVKSTDEEVKRLCESANPISQEALDALVARTKPLRDRLDQTTAEINEAQGQFDLLEPFVEAGDFDSVLDLVGDNILRRLIQSGASDEQLRSRSLRLLAEQRANLTAAQDRKAALEQSLSLLQERVDVQSEGLVQLNTLVREAEANRVLYETFLTRLKETSIQLGLQRPDSRVLSEATSAYFVAPRKKVILALGAIVGLMIGFGLVMLRFFRSDGFMHSSELERHTGYPVLGQLPQVPIRRREQLLSYIQKNPTSIMSEAVRNLRTSLLMLDMQAPPKIIMLSSSRPGESKTTTSIYLAKSLADLGGRVLLVEADIRRMTFDTYFTTKGEGSLLSVLDGSMPLTEAAKPTELGFDVLKGTKSSVNAADIFSSTEFADMISEAREAYDYVVLDTPPVLVVPDARIIARHVDAVVYLVSWNGANKSQVAEGIGQFTNVGAPLYGTILAKIDRKRATSYGYGYAYGGHGTGYYDT
ncbi:GumC family protein [Antarctobacter sp.]|uniref:GumC family protein n=1 Tax=Antarctobacter sp. TaxID=1872577 RepID=UPI002B2711C6|nr:polysaccharide biosynthesis tyrosine autokinase [Antarctobacter sp.]